VNLSMTTDYAAPDGCPEPYLRRIADAGFTHVHWCQQWNSDFLYDVAEIDAISAWMKEFGLSLTDLHASSGQEKRWTSPREYERMAGVELIKNRIAMARRLGADIIIMHTGGEPEGKAELKRFWEQLLKSLDELESVSREHGVRIAIENAGKAPITERLLGHCPPDYLGLCYDSGHGNIHPEDLDQCEAHKDRLLSIHLHDNDGLKDLHRIPFTGTTDWERVAALIATSAYAKWPNLETTMSNSPIEGEQEFLAEAYRAAERLAGMIETRQRKDGAP
jgi:sugar phosphate isomerase/epimerase